MFSGGVDSPTKSPEFLRGPISRKEEGWLDRLFTLIEQNHEWLETTTFSEYLKKEPPRGRVYLPTASYM